MGIWARNISDALMEPRITELSPGCEPDTHPPGELGPCTALPDSGSRPHVANDTSEPPHLVDMLQGSFRCSILK